MEPFKDDTDLIAELRALRAQPRPEFTAELDERAAAGFPRRSGDRKWPLSGLIARLRAMPPRRMLLPVGATALAAIAVATVVVASSEPNHPSTSAVTESATLASGEKSSGSPPHGERYEQYSEAKPAPPSLKHHLAARGDASGIQYSDAPPIPTSSSAHHASGAGGESLSGTASETGPFASKATHRSVERSAEMVLGAEPTEVGDEAAQVFEAVHAYDGIVLSSSVTAGTAGDAGARFDLLIPSAKLSDALAAFSGIAEVRSRHEATDDITAPTVSIGEELQDSRAKVDGLLVQLAGADSDSERAEVEAELHAERRHAAALRSQVAKLDRRANLSRVSLRIETGATSTSDDSSDQWGIGDALDDAGHILGIAVGVTVVGLAIVGPLTLIALLVWLANRAWLRRRRERALD